MGGSHSLGATFRSLDLFIPVTTNPHQPEIEKSMKELPNQEIIHYPDFGARNFRMRQEVQDLNRSVKLDQQNHKTTRKDVTRPRLLRDRHRQKANELFDDNGDLLVEANQLRKEIICLKKDNTNRPSFIVESDIEDNQ